jgi:hypothetical protein
MKSSTRATPSANGRLHRENKTARKLRKLLAPQHLADLRRSGLSTKTILAAGLRTEHGAREIAELLHWSRPAPSLGECLVIPFADLDGERIDYQRLKPDTPRTDKNNKVVKYEAPKGQPNRAYFPPGIKQLLADHAAPVILVEGEKKTLAGAQAGFPTIGLTGVWSWQRKRERDENGRGIGPRELIPDLAERPWQGRQVFIAFDSDILDKPDALLAESELARVLQEHGALVGIVRLPPATDGSKQGLDDFLVAHDADALKQLLTEAAAEIIRPATALTTLPSGPPWPDPLAAEAFHGLAGDIVRALEPASESDPAALLLQTLVGLGNLLGRTAHAVVEADRHFGNEFVVLVGRTAKGRKGTSWGHVRRLLAAADEGWGQSRILHGLSSGEGVIWQVRDRIMARHPVKEHGRVVSYEEVESDPGITDKRLLVIESEFAGVLKQVERQGNVLSPVLRLAWETGDLATLTKNNPARATGAHVSIVGHCTAEELNRYLSTTEMANGFGNRSLWACVRRSKELPEGGQADPAVMTELGRRLGKALAFGRGLGDVRRDDGARELWRAVYSTLSADRPGLAGAMLGRAEAHVLRLSLLYAVLDRSPVVQTPHLLAALAVWDYCEASVRYVFGAALGDPLADDIRRRLAQAAPGGMTRWELSNALGRHQSAERIGRALALLAEYRLARPERRETRGRPEERWHAVTAGLSSLTSLSSQGE